MPDKILRVLRWSCLLLAGTISWQVYGIVTAPEPFDRIGDLALEDLELETPPPAESTEEAAKEITDETIESTSNESADGKITVPTPPGKEEGKPEVGGPDKKGEQNKGEQNKGEQNKGEQNKGEQNKGEQNKGEQNKGEQNKAVSSSPPFPAALEIVATSGILGKAPTKKPQPPVLLGTLGKYAMIRSPDGKEDLVAEGGVFGGVKVIKISTNRALIEYQDQKTELTVYSGMGSSTLIEPVKKKTEEKTEEKKKADAPETPAGADSPESTPPKATQEKS